MSALRSIGLALLALVLVCGSTAADEIGSFDGAVWRFGMTPKGGGKKLRGAFRVNNHVLFPLLIVATTKPFVLALRLNQCDFLS